MALLWPNNKKKKPDSGDWVKVSGSWPIWMQLVLPLAPEVGAYNSVRGPCVESSCENGAEPGGQKKWQEAELFPGNVQISGSNHACSPQQIWKTDFLGQFEKKNPKLLIIQSILVYIQFCTGFFAFFVLLFLPNWRKAHTLNASNKNCISHMNRHRNKKWRAFSHSATKRVLKKKQGEPPNPSQELEC